MKKTKVTRIEYVKYIYMLVEFSFFLPVPEK